MRRFLVIVLHKIYGILQENPSMNIPVSKSWAIQALEKLCDAFTLRRQGMTTKETQEMQCKWTRHW